MQYKVVKHASWEDKKIDDGKHQVILHFLYIFCFVFKIYIVVYSVHLINIHTISSTLEEIKEGKMEKGRGRRDSVGHFIAFFCWSSLPTPSINSREDNTRPATSIS